MDLSRKPFNVRVSVRNNLILRAIADMGFKSQAEFTRFAGAKDAHFNGLIGLREAPINNSGDFTPAARLLMEVLGASPSDLWTDEQLTMALRRNTAECEMDSDDVMRLAHAGVLQIERQSGVDESDRKMLSEQIRRLVFDGGSRLTKREEKVLKLRFGIECRDEHTLDEVSDVLAVTRERIRQIEAKALRKLRKAEHENPRLRRIVEPDCLTFSERRAKHAAIERENAKWLAAPEVA